MKSQDTVASFTKEVDSRLAKRPYNTNGVEHQSRVNFLSKRRHGGPITNMV